LPQAGLDSIRLGLFFLRSVIVATLITADWMQATTPKIGDSVVRVGDAGDWTLTDDLGSIDASAGLQYGVVKQVDLDAARVCVEPATVSVEPMPE
jgi:hypothetical protein